MKMVPIVLLIFQIVQSDACCAEGSTIIQIKNYEGPIYLHGPHQCDDKTLYHLTPKTECDYDCNCVSKSSSCVPINTACQCTSGLYNVPYSYQDSVNQCTPGLYCNVPACMYQDNQYYPAVPVTTQCGRQDGSYMYGTCGRTYY